MFQFVEALKQSAIEFIADGCLSTAAAIAYYAIFAIPPVTMVVFLLVSYFGISQEQINESIKQRLGIPAARNSAVAGTNRSTASSSSNSAAQVSLGKVAQRTKSQRAAKIGTLNGIVGIVVLLFTATGLFSELQLALNRAWGVEPDKKRNAFKQFFFKRLISLGLILFMALLLLSSVLLTTVLNEIYSNVRGALPGYISQAMRFILNNLATLLIATPLFAAVFKLIPDADMRWRDVWLGATATAVMFLVGNTLISWYLSRANLGSSWGGAATSIVAVLAWFYYTSLIILFGAELTQIWARTIGHGFEPQVGAVAAKDGKSLSRQNQ